LLARCMRKKRKRAGRRTGARRRSIHMREHKLGVYSRKGNITHICLQTLQPGDVPVTIAAWTKTQPISRHKSRRKKRKIKLKEREAMSR
jgi:Trm5-related predicted tRNA methylase